ncbi:hypothetical protein [Bacillus sp. 2205SS5-2]
MPESLATAARSRNAEGAPPSSGGQMLSNGEGPDLWSWMLFVP